MLYRSAQGATASGAGPARNRQSRRVPRVVGAALAAALALSPFASGGVMARAQEREPTIDEIAANPAAYYGETVTVTGSVEDILGPRSFTVGDDDLFLHEEVAVVSTAALTDDANQPMSADALADGQVRVTGTVHQFNLEAFEDRLGFDLPDGPWSDRAGQPAIIASSVTPLSAGPEMGQADEAGRGMQVAPAVVVPVGPSATATTVDRITDSPESFYGQDVAVIGEIGDVLGPRSFTLEDDDLLFDEEMTIVSNRPLVGRDGAVLSLEALSGRRALVTGTVHQLNVSAFEERLGIDLADDDFADRAGQPAMIARSIMLDPVLYAPPGVHPYGAPVSSGAPGVDPIPEAQSVTVDAITDDPGAYYGHTVTIAGEVGQALGPRSFTVEDSDLLFDEVVGVIGTGPLLDRNGRPYSADALDDLHVLVTGTVRHFSQEDLERELGVDLSGEGVDAWEGQPVIVAESVRQLR